jgi:serine/threonine protein kinase
MSPEQAQGRPADARSDLFSFGLVLYELLTGRRAFDGANPTSVIAAILEREPPSVAAVAPRSVDRVLQKCLAKDPGERWQAARDILHALDLIDETSASVVTSPGRSRTVAFASLAGFVAVSGLGLALYPRPPRHRRPGVNGAIRSMGLRVLKTPVRTPQANAFGERVIGTIRRECLDWLIPFHEPHLRGILREWVPHDNRGRPHPSLAPGIPELPPTPITPAPTGPRLPTGSRVIATPVLNGLHHEYQLVREAA